MEAFLYIQSRYYHDIEINLDQVVENGAHSDGNKLSNGIMTLGPRLKENKIYQEIKKNTDFINLNIVSIFSGVGEKNNRIQLGGYQ